MSHAWHGDRRLMVVTDMDVVAWPRASRRPGTSERRKPASGRKPPVSQRGRVKRMPVPTCVHGVARWGPVIGEQSI